MINLVSSLSTLNPKIIGENKNTALRMNAFRNSPETRQITNFP